MDTVANSTSFIASAVSNQKPNSFNVHHVSGGFASDDSLETLIGMSQDKRGGFVSCSFDVNPGANPEVPAHARDCLETTAAFPGTLQVLGKGSSPSLPMRRVESWSKENGAVSILKITLPVCHSPALPLYTTSPANYSALWSSLKWTERRKLRSLTRCLLSSTTSHLSQPSRNRKRPCFSCL